MKTINTIKKVSLATLLTFVLSLSSVFAQNDTMYIMKSGAIVGQYIVNTEVDSVIFYKPTIEETTTGTFTDSRDGKVYNWVQIGDQVWMAENLAWLPSVSPSKPQSYTDPIYYIYDYQGINSSEAMSTSNYQTYGVLYNWPAAIDACPSGWHLPTDEEWTELTDFLGGIVEAGGKLKESSTTHWKSPNTGATNETAFTALPGGNRNNNGGGIFNNIGGSGQWWSTSESSASTAYQRTVFYYESKVGRGMSDKRFGFSVRCVKDKNLH